MALIFSATAWAYLTMELVPQNNLTNIFFNTTNAIIQRIVWITLQLSAVFSYSIFEATSIMFWWLTMIQQNSITSMSTHNRHSSRKFKRKYFSSKFRISAYNRKILIMSSFMLHSWLSIFFSNPMHPETVGVIGILILVRYYIMSYLS